VVVGLGNPGSEYEPTRHNAGFWAVDALAGKLHRFTGWKRDKGMLRGDGRAAGRPITLVKPQDFMNRSGGAVRSLIAEGWVASEILVIADDVYLPLGTIRLRPNGGAGGHNGLESIIAAVGSGDFPRLRIGVGPAPASADLPQYVLAPFREEERALVPPVVEAARDCAFDAAAAGLTQAMNRWNRFGREATDT